jgi:hypothetical protein
LKKIFIPVAALTLFLKSLTALAQTPAESMPAVPEPDSSVYTDRKLHLDEINLVSSYYRQDGNNSAVTGGIGTEKLTDFATVLDINLVRQDRRNLQHNLLFELGVDAYTSASSDKIDPATVSSASSSDKRIYPSIGYTISNEQNGSSAGLVASYSHEYDYRSYGLGLNLAKASADKNRELSLHLQAYWDTWEIILPVELRGTTGNGGEGKNFDGSAPRYSYSASVSYAMVINPRLQVALLADGIYQNGLLATRYQRVYFSDQSVQAEVLPDQRLKIPVGVRMNYFLGSRFILRGYYRFYTDDWGITAHTASLEVPIKISPFLSVAPGYRYYTQTAADYFAPIYQHTATDSYFTSDYDLSAFQSQFESLNIRYVPENGVLGMRHWKSAELRYGHYNRSNGLASDIITLAMQFK